MSWAVVYREEATEDIAAAMGWYEARVKGLGDRFLKEVLTCERLIGQFPKGAPVVYKHFRQLPMKGFPYVIIYGLWRGTVLVYRIFHTSMAPERRIRRS